MPQTELIAGEAATFGQMLTVDAKTGQLVKATSFAPRFLCVAAETIDTGDMVRINRLGEARKVRPDPDLED
jgi:hypothetical protein